jgi:hypothetical protein
VFVDHGGKAVSVAAVLAGWGASAKVAVVASSVNASTEILRIMVRLFKSG